MRIIAGSLKGRRLAAPNWPGLRPTSDTLRETLFNVMAGRVPGARVLDGFAGTGAVGLEAISRGAAHVTFLERDPRATRLIAENARRCGVWDGYAIIRADMRDAARRAPGPFDLVLLDPPYDMPDLDRHLARVAHQLAEGGLLVLEHARRRAAPEHIGSLRRTRDLVSGDSALAFYETG